MNVPTVNRFVLFRFPHCAPYRELASRGIGIHPLMEAKVPERVRFLLQFDFPLYLHLKRPENVGRPSHWKASDETEGQENRDAIKSKHDGLTRPATRPDKAWQGLTKPGEACDEASGASLLCPYFVRECQHGAKITLLSSAEPLEERFMLLILKTYPL